jgi:hypothetical protein
VDLVFCNIAAADDLIPAIDLSQSFVLPIKQAKRCPATSKTSGTVRSQL